MGAYFLKTQVVGLRRLMIGVVFGAAIVGSAFANEVEIVNIRVGQGDATLIRGPAAADGSRVSVLFDAGDVSDPVGGRVVGAVLARRGIRSLNFVIVSHYDVDHIGGIVHGPPHGKSFLVGPNGTPGDIGDDDGDGADGWLAGQEFIEPDRDEIGKGDDVAVGTFVDRGDEPQSTTMAARKYRAMAGSMGQRISLDTQGEIDSFEIDLGGGAKMIALAGSGFVRSRSSKIPKVTTENERSLSFLLAYKNFHFLISGDMIGRQFGSEDAQVETAVGDVIQNMGVIVDVLHVDHHGANNGSEATFLDKIKPTIAVISMGNGNDHQHPNHEALERLESARVYRILQTSWGTTQGEIPEHIRRIQAIYQSDVVITSDGDRFTISTARTFEVDKNPRRP